MVTISYDEKPGIQALATTTPALPPAPEPSSGLRVQTTGNGIVAGGPGQWYGGAQRAGHTAIAGVLMRSRIEVRRG